MGWWTCSFLSLSRAAGLLARLAAVGPASHRRRLPSDILIYAATRTDSWSSSVLQRLENLRVPSMASFGIGPGVSAQLVRHWRCRVLQPSLQAAFIQCYRSMIESIDSLDQFGLVQGIPSRPQWPYNDIRLARWVRLWGLARCGHHPFSDGRAARHRGTCNLVCPCGSADFTLQHALCHCPRMSTLRRTWALHVGLGCLSPALVAAAASSNWLFDLEDGRNSRGIMTAHIIYVGRVCDWAEGQ